jgi:hypothetical protein
MEMVHEKNRGCLKTGEFQKSNGLEACSRSHHHIMRFFWKFLLPQNVGQGYVLD